MTREQYNTQRTKLMNDMRAAIDAGDTATANSCRDQVRALDNQWEAEAQARADFAALQNSARSFTPADVTPAQTNAVTQIVNFAAVPQGTPTDPSETAEYRNAFMAYVCHGTEISADLRQRCPDAERRRYHDHPPTQARLSPPRLPARSSNR